MRPSTASLGAKAQAPLAKRTAGPRLATAHRVVLPRASGDPHGTSPPLQRPQLDPDYKIHAKDGWAFLAQHIRNLQPGSEEGAAYGECLERIGESRLVIHQLVYQLVYLAIMFTLAWSGHAIEAALIWWIPKIIAGVHLRYYLSWVPHHPPERQGRYLDTRHSNLSSAIFSRQACSTTSFIIFTLGSRLVLRQPLTVSCAPF